MTDKLRCVISDPVIKKVERKMKGWELWRRLIICTVNSEKKGATD